jgi:hypothetical protein
MPDNVGNYPESMAESAGCMMPIRTHWQYTTHIKAARLAATAVLEWCESLPDVSDDDELADVPTTVLDTLAAVSQQLRAIVDSVDAASGSE